MRNWALAILALSIIAVTFVYFFAQEVITYLWENR